MLRNRILKPIILGIRGVNFWNSTEEMAQPGNVGEALLFQNCFYRRGVQKRLGSAKHSTNQVVSSKSIVGLHRFYYGTSDKRLIAACGTNVSEMNDSTGVWTGIRTTQTDSTMTHMVTWGATNKMYVANGVDVPFSIDSSLVASTITAAPATTLMLAPYRSRLFSIERTNPSSITWSDADYTTTGWTTANPLKMPGSGGCEAIFPHYLGNAVNGLESKLFIVKPTSCSLLWGLDLDPTSTNFEFRTRLDHVSDRIGTISPKSLATTPVGTIFLGSDRQVYLLPFGRNELTPIGHKIYSQTSANIGLESIPLSQMSKAAAIYHDGFYKLTFPVSGGTSNTRQYWLDVDKLYKDENNHYGPWYGPMTGMGISCFVHQNGSGDDGRLLGGEAGATGFVYQLSEAGIYADVGSNITMIFQSRHEPFANEALDARVMTSELETLDVANTITVSFNDTIGPISTSTSISPSSTGIYWGDAYWGDEYWTGGGLPVRRKAEHYEKYITGRFFSTSVEYTSGTDDFRLFSITHEAVPVRQTFQVRP